MELRTFHPQDVLLQDVSPLDVLPLKITDDGKNILKAKTVVKMTNVEDNG